MRCKWTLRQPTTGFAQAWMANCNTLNGNIDLAEWELAMRQHSHHMKSRVREPHPQAPDTARSVWQRLPPGRAGWSRAIGIAVKHTPQCITNRLFERPAKRGVLYFLRKNPWSSEFHPTSNCGVAHAPPKRYT